MRSPLLSRTHWVRTIAALDPIGDYERIAAITARHEFPWDVQQALSFALFRTYAVPSIGRLLDETGEFTQRTQKRHDDTALLLDEISEHGLASPDGRRAIRRVNQMHRAYDITNDDMRYVLATFVVVPARWIEAYGWRRLTVAEIDAGTAYYRRLGELMGIRDIPATYTEFAQFLDEYEAEHFAYDDGGRRVAEATLELLCSFYPRPARRIVRVFAISIMDDHLRRTFRFAAPAPIAVRASRSALRLRGRLESLLPARRHPKRVKNLRIVRSYPNGFDVDDLGTFPSGCPVPRPRTANTYAK